MPDLLENPVADAFSDLIPQSEGSDYGDFSDLVPATATGNNGEFGDFSDLVPSSPTGESEKVLAETPQIEPPKPEAPKADTGVVHQTLNAVRVFGSAAGKYIFNGLQGLELETAKALSNPPSELITPQAEAVLLPKEHQDALEQQYIAETQAAVPDALARAGYWKGRAETIDEESAVDPALANTVPARLSAAAGHAVAMGMESLIPGAGLPLMVLHGALATEAEAKNAGKSDAEAEQAAVRSAIGLGIFGGASKVAALGVAKLLPKVVSDPTKLTTFVSQFVGQEAANETSSRVIGAWEAAANAPEGQKVHAALNALSEQTLEGAALNLVYAGMHAARATGVRPKGVTEMESRDPAIAARLAEERATSPAIESVRSSAPETGMVPETQRYVKPVREAVPAVGEARPKTVANDLDSAAQAARSSDEFIRIIQRSALEAEQAGKDLRTDHGLLSDINKWAESTPENSKRFKNTGWFGIASEFWKERKAPEQTISQSEPNTASKSEGESNALQIRSAAPEISRPIETREDQVRSGQGMGRGEPRPQIARPRTEEKAEALVPEYLRQDPEVQRLLNPAEKVTPQMKMATAAEGGALFSRGGARTTVAPKGETPKGDTNFLRVEPGIKRTFKGLERKGAADVIAETSNKVGKLLSNAMRKHVDTEQEIHGQLYSKFDKAVSGPTKTVEKAFDELEPYLAARENGRPLPAISPKAKEILTAWEDIAESTGNLARANNVQVFDPVAGAHRPIGNLGRTYLPRVFKPEVERVMRDPKQNPTLWNNLVDAFAKHRGISDVEAAKELRAEAGRFSANDFMGNLERARTGQLPEIFYDYDLRRVASRYIPSFSERMAQIISYGQRLGPREQPQRENLWDIARKEAENDYTQRWLNSAEDQAVNLRSKTASGTGMARAQTLASGLLLSSPTTSVIRNTLSGLTSTAELMGVRRSLAPIKQAMSRAERANAREMGAVRSDMGDFLHADRLGESLTDDVIRVLTDKALKFSGYNGSEVFVRTHSALAASQFARDGIAAIAKNPKSMRAKEALAMFQRMGTDAKKIVAEGADWKSGAETRKFIRTVIRDTQGGYRFDQVPLWANSNVGRFLYQFGRWGTQRARNIWKNGVKPALGEEVQWNGKTMTRRDVRPLLKMAGSAVALGEGFALVAAGLFGRDRRDASTEEIRQAWKEDEKTAVALAFERGINDIIMAGTLGIWGQPIDWAKSLKNQSRLKNPTEPPGLGSTRALMELGQAAIDQEWAVTKADLLKFAGNIVPGAKQVSDVARNVMDEPLYEAQNDVKTLRAAAQRWAKREGMDVSPRAKGEFRKSPMAPTYEPIKEALLIGDAATAKVLATEFLNKQTGAARSKARQSLKASIQQSQPFRAGPYTAKVHRDRFQTWARQNLSEADYLQTKRIQERYMKAAQAAGLW